jgi:radical SAM superfamily enzyme YgiQ (UPF0313 family)
MKNTIAFVTLGEFDNLGVGYMAAVLKENGFRVKIFDVRDSKKQIINKIHACKPLIIGFSIVYHGNFKRFTGLITYIRSNCSDIHFTAGGHYATLNTDELLTKVPELDSIVRFEGEYSMLELAQCLESGSDWKYVAGIAYRGTDRIIRNAPKPLEKDLDKFPYPLRSSLRKFVFEMPCATLIAGRGCLYNCTFCNTRSFYNEAGGPVKRIRKPEKVAQEISYLNKNSKCFIFLFVDDDFPINPYNQTDWIDNFCLELCKYELNDKIIWKICCRPDEVIESKFRLMKKHGLFSVFLGIEDGNDDGLKRLNKQISVQKIIESIRILKKLKLNLDYGFMLFQPSTTFRSLNENLNFLLNLFGDGYSPVTYLKLLPFYKTKIREQLLNEGRLKDAEGMLDYDFIEPGMNEYYNFVTSCFRAWLRKPGSVHGLATLGNNYFSVFSKYFRKNTKAIRLKYDLKKIVSASNLFIINEMKQIANIYESGCYMSGPDVLNKHEKLIVEKESFYTRKIYGVIDRLYTLAFRSLFFMMSSEKSTI